MSVPVHYAHTAFIDPNTLKPKPVNPNRHSAHQIQLLASIIQEKGWRNPVTVSKRSGLIVRGHGRLEAALLIGCPTIPVDEQDDASTDGGAPHGNIIRSFEQSLLIHGVLLTMRRSFRTHPLRHLRSQGFTLG